ncbi:MAG: 2Fe-2S iron-sulfur cluster-binding protein [Burkholderiaceae bacterium]|jgi:ferredoxin-NAD(P)+ reductase (naphthalene dioxygenase ferredoxin-specific)
MELVVHPLEQVLQVSPGANLLETLRANDVPISYSCMAGRCGTCRCKLVSGSLLDTGREAKITNPAEGDYILACTSVLTENCAIEIPEPDEVVIHPARIIKATVTSITDATHDIKLICLQPAKPISFSPGQYVSLQFAPDSVRPYSMAGLCTDSELTFHVRHVPDGRVTGYVFNQLKVGDSVRVSGPLGTAYLRTRHEGPMLCVAGGTGLAPILSIVRGAIAAGMDNPIHLYFGVRSPVDIYGMDQLKALQAELPSLKLEVVVTSDDESSSQYRLGLITDAIAQDIPDFQGWRAYICGAPPMVEATAALVKQRGIEEQQVYADAFYASGT